MFCCERREEMSNAEWRFLILLICLDNCCCWGTFGLMSDVELKREVDGSVNEGRVPSSTKIWLAERAKNWTDPLVLPAAGLAAMQRGNGHYYIKSSSLYSRTSLGYITRRPCPRVLPRGAHNPAGTRGDIQAVTQCLPLRTHFLFKSLQFAVTVTFFAVA